LTPNRKLQLGQLLLKCGALSDAQLAQALDYQRQNGNSLLLGEVLIKLAICSEEQIMEALANGYGVPFARISPKITDPKVIDLLRGSSSTATPSCLCSKSATA